MINYKCIAFRCEPVNISSGSVQFNPVVNPTTTLCAALLMPTTAAIVGNLLFDNGSYSNFHKTLLVSIKNIVDCISVIFHKKFLFSIFLFQGGLVYIAVKGALRIYQRQHNAIKERTRKVVDYPEVDADTDGTHL